MQYVVCYDITDDARRTKVALALLDYGARTQESVFVANLDEELARRMMERLGRLIDANEDKIHIFRACKNCASQTIALGVGEVAKDAAFYVI